MRSLLGLLIASLLVSAQGSWAATEAKAPCAELWQRSGALTEVTRAMARLNEVPDAGAIEGLEVKSLFRNDGMRFIPSSIQESSCYLDRALPYELRMALVEGAEDAIRHHRRSNPESLLDAMSNSTDRRLTKLYPDFDYLSFLVYIEFEYYIVDIGYEGQSPLQRDAYLHGVYRKTSIARYLWLSYLEHLGVKGAGPAVKHIKTLEASYGPPSELKPDGCREGVSYQWPALFRPAMRRTDWDPPNHWGVCSSTGQPWIYQLKRGWRKASDGEVKDLCEGRFSDGPFAEICRTH